MEAQNVLTVGGLIIVGKPQQFRTVLLLAEIAAHSEFPRFPAFGIDNMKALIEGSHIGLIARCKPLSFGPGADVCLPNCACHDTLLADIWPIYSGEVRETRVKLRIGRFTGINEVIKLWIASKSCFVLAEGAKAFLCRRGGLLS